MPKNGDSCPRSPERYSLDLCFGLFGVIFIFYSGICGASYLQFHGIPTGLPLQGEYLCSSTPFESLPDWTICVSQSAKAWTGL